MGSEVRNRQESCARRGRRMNRWLQSFVITSSCSGHNNKLFSPRVKRAILIMSGALELISAPRVWILFLSRTQSVKLRKSNDHKGGNHADQLCRRIGIVFPCLLPSTESEMRVDKGQE